MFRNWILVIVLYALAPPGVCGERFSGSGTLSEAHATSTTNDRFRLHAEFSAGSVRSMQKAGSEPTTSSPPRPLEMNNGRFGLSARFSDALNGSLCGLAPTETIFAHGFEN